MPLEFDSNPYGVSATTKRKAKPPRNPFVAANPRPPAQYRCGLKVCRCCR